MGNSPVAATAPPPPRPPPQPPSESGDGPAEAEPSGEPAPKPSSPVECSPEECSTEQSSPEQCSLEPTAEPSAPPPPALALSPSPPSSPPSPCHATTRPTVSSSAPDNAYKQREHRPAGVHRSRRMAPQSAPAFGSAEQPTTLSATASSQRGVPPPSYAEATGCTVPPIRQWAGATYDRPPVYSSRRPSPMPAAANVRTVASILRVEVSPQRRGPPERTGRLRTAARFKPAWGPYPMRVQCSRCHRTVVTTVMVEDSEFTHLCALTLCLLGCWPCCLMPYCMTSCRRVWHSCPRCGNAMGVYNPRTPTSRSPSPHVTDIRA